MVLLCGIKVTARYLLPGAVGEVINFTKEDLFTLTFIMDGAALLNAMDQMAKDEQWWREKVLAGTKPFDDGPMDQAMNEKLFGKKGPIRAIIPKAEKVYFDFDAEVEEAKKGEAKLLEDLGIGTPNDLNEE